jgi:uncharacterized Tic20 family protein
VTNSRKQANYRRKIAYLFFIFLSINLILKLAGVSTLDTTTAINASQALGMKITYFAVPAFFLILGLLFVRLSKSKAMEAHNIELGGARW